jgi:hypothetical protein
VTAASFGLAWGFIGIAPESGTGLGGELGAAAFDEVARFGDDVFQNVCQLPDAGLAVDNLGSGFDYARFVWPQRIAPSVVLAFRGAGVIGNNTPPSDWKSKGMRISLPLSLAGWCQNSRPRAHGFVRTGGSRI